MQSFTRDLLSHSLRADYRTSTETRPLSNKILFQSKILITKPHHERPHRGIFRINIDHPIKHTLKKVFLRNKVIDLEGLCIIYNELVFNITVDLKILECDGDILRECLEVLKENVKKLELHNYILDIKNYYLSEPNCNVNKFINFKLCDLIDIECVEYIKEQIQLMENEELLDLNEIMILDFITSLTFNMNARVALNFDVQVFYYVGIDKFTLLDPNRDEMAMKEWEFVCVTDGRNVVWCEKIGRECDMKEIMNLIKVSLEK